MQQKPKNITRSGMTQWDQPLLWTTILLVLVGVVMVYSASITIANGAGSSGNQTSISYLIRHVASIFIAVIAGLIVYQIPLKVWDRVSPLIFWNYYFLINCCINTWLRPCR
jgi:cell division protein FtsW